MNKFKIGDYVELIEKEMRGRRGFVRHIHKVYGCWQYDIDTAYGFITKFEDCLRIVDMDGRAIAEEFNRAMMEGINSYKNILNGINMTEAAFNVCNRRIPNIENVIFNNPATIVFWSDGSKTIVKCTDEAFDEEKGLAMAISKKVLGNKGNYYNEFKKWLPEIEVWGINGGISMVEACRKAHDAVESFNKAMKGE